MMTKYVTVLGTHGWPDDYTRQWWHWSSPFCKFLRARGLMQAHPDKPFVWSGDLQGVPLLGAGRDWEAGAKSLGYYNAPLPFDARNVIAHSHGGAVAILSAKEAPIRSLITIGTPVRKAVQAAAAEALKAGHIGRWTHVYDQKGDRTQWLGQLFDGRWFGARAFQLAGMTDDAVPGIGHSGVLNDAGKFDLWVKRGWLDALVQGPEIVG